MELRIICDVASYQSSQENVSKDKHDVDDDGDCDGAGRHVHFFANFFVNQTPFSASFLQFLMESRCSNVDF